MNMQTHPLIHGLLFAIGLVLIIGGTAMHAGGAVVIGLIVAAVNIRQVLKFSSET